MAIKLTTVTEEKKVLSQFWSGVRYNNYESDKYSAVVALNQYLPSNGILDALASFIRDADSTEASPARAALKYLANNITLKVARETIENTSISHPCWQIQSAAREVIRRRDFAAMIAACE